MRKLTDGYVLQLLGWNQRETTGMNPVDIQRLIHLKKAHIYLRREINIKSHPEKFPLAQVQKMRKEAELYFQIPMP